MRLLRLMLLALLAVISLPALAVEPDERLKNPVLEERARELSKHLRCLVCQNQSIDDSAAPLAKDLRVLVRERLVAGDSDGQVLDYLTQRYGSFVLLKPPMKPETWLLWFGPFVVLILGAAGLYMVARRRRTEAAPGAVPLSAEERARLEAVLNEDRASPTAAPVNPRSKR